MTKRMTDERYAQVRGMQPRSSPFAEECDRARAREQELETALRDLLVGAWDPDENELEFYERVADEFRRDTGFLRPGKDEAAGGSRHSEKERREAWDKWVVDRARARVAKVRAALGDE